MSLLNNQAPNFSLMNQKDELFQLSDLKGKWVVLFFYPKDMTPYCTIEARDFSSYLKEFKLLNVEVFGISSDSTESHRKFIANFELKIDLLSDTEKNVANLYGVIHKKSLFGKEFCSLRRTTYLINPKGIVDFIWQNVNVLGHVDQIIQHLKNKNLDGVLS